MPQQPRATIDCETRSARSLSASGSWRYSLDPTTEALCLAYHLPHWGETRTGLWHPAFAIADLEEGEDFDDLTELFRWVMRGGLIEAHNVWFERGVWTNILSHWPQVAPEQWRCSAAKAAAHALPRGLAGAAQALDLDVIKDDAGLRTALGLDGSTTRSMTKMSQPRKPVKAEQTAWGVQHAGCALCAGSGKVAGVNPETGRAKKQACPRCKGKGFRGVVPPMPRLYHETREQMTELFAYCRQDVLAEKALSRALPDLSDDETRMFQLDQTINERGFQLDPDAVTAALTLIDGESVTLNAELFDLTDGMVAKATQRAQMMNWLQSEGVLIANTRKETVEDLLGNDDDYDEEESAPWIKELAPKPRRALEIMKALGKSSTAKYEKMTTWMCPDARVRGGLLYHGATTGRWTGAGIQPHNFPKGSPALLARKIKQDVLWEDLKTLNAEHIRSTYGDVMEALSYGLRGTLVAAEGHTLFVADYASIEARVVNWLADNEEALDIFRSGADVYCYMATDIYGYPTHKDTHIKERQVGKEAVLGLGYQMGWAKFVERCALAGVTITGDQRCTKCNTWSREHRRERHNFVSPNEEEITAVKVVEAFRAKFWRIKDQWRLQEQQAIAAVLDQNFRHDADHVSWFVDGRFLYCELPSGRLLAYPDPEVRTVVTPWGEDRNQLTFMGVNPINHQWMRQHTYGGSLIENITQAVARDIMADAMVRCEESGLYVPVLSVHDEVITEAVKGTGSVKEFENLLTAGSSWSGGLPIGAEGWQGDRYHK